MLEKPDLPDEKIAACVREAYGLPVDQVAFLPLGADGNTAVYRITTQQTAYFLKLRGGVFDETSVMLPQCLNRQGITAIIPPLPTAAGQFWTHLDTYTVILYPDDPILAPKERDLMYAGGGLMGRWRAPQEEEALFYQGYGSQTAINMKEEICKFKITLFW